MSRHWYIVTAVTAPSRRTPYPSNSEELGAFPCAGASAAWSGAMRARARAVRAARMRPSALLQTLAQSLKHAARPGWLLRQLDLLDLASGLLRPDQGFQRRLVMVLEFRRLELAHFLVDQ